MRVVKDPLLNLHKINDSTKQPPVFSLLFNSIADVKN